MLLVCAVRSYMSCMCFASHCTIALPPLLVPVLVFEKASVLHAALRGVREGIGAARCASRCSRRHQCCTLRCQATPRELHGCRILHLLHAALADDPPGATRVSHNAFAARLLTCMLPPFFVLEHCEVLCTFMHFVSNIRRCAGLARLSLKFAAPTATGRAASAAAAVWSLVERSDFLACPPTRSVVLTPTAP